MERIIHFTVPRERTPLQDAAILAARRLHPDWDVRVWEDPVSFEGSRLEAWYDRPPTGAGRADLIRLDVVNTFGGIYLDSDVILEKSLDRLVELDHFFCSEDGYVVTNAVFGATKGNAHVVALIDGLLDDEPDWALQPHLTTGPHYLARILQWRSGLTLVPRDTFFPFGWGDHPVDPLPTTYGIHHWAASWWPEDMRERRAARLSRSQQERLTLRERLAVRSRLRSVFQHVARRLGWQPAPPQRISSVTEGPSANYFTGESLIVATREKVVMALPADDLSVVPMIALYGTYEPKELAFIRSVLKGGDFMIDVGCNVGLHTLVAAKSVGPFGRVFSFDPNQRLLEHLAMSLRMNWMHDRVTLAPVAVGEQSGSARFSFPLRNSEEGSVAPESHSARSRLRESFGSSDEIDVPVVRLDEHFPLGIEIKLLKIDVEGHDRAVLAGASGLFRERCVAHLLVEVLEEAVPGRYRQLVEELARIEECGYEIRSLGKGGSLSDAIPAQALRAGTGRRGRNLVLSRC